MAQPAFWQQAWDLAQPRLTTIKTALEGARGPEARNPRVGQLDSELLDQELLQLLREPIYKSLDILNVRSIRLENAQRG
jgi:peroxin-2